MSTASGPARSRARAQIALQLSQLSSDQGSPGMHLHVPRGNQNAAGFYRHIGFTELPATPDELPAPHVLLFGMDL